MHPPSYEQLHIMNKEAGPQHSSQDSEGSVHPEDLSIHTSWFHESLLALLECLECHVHWLSTANTCQKGKRGFVTWAQQKNYSEAEQRAIMKLLTLIRTTAPTTTTRALHQEEDTTTVQQMSWTAHLWAEMCLSTCSRDAKPRKLPRNTS